MEINLNMQADTLYEMFNIQDERSNELLDCIATICSTAYETFPADYSVAISENGTHRLDIPRMLAEMIAATTNEYEKNYVLYIAQAGIGRVHDLLASAYV